MKKTSLKLLGTALATAFLASCGGESSNLADPERPIVSTCTADTCVSGIFVADGVVEGLNYECGNIRSKTNFQGEFSCPLEKAASKVTFLISHADTGNKVTLGEYTFRPVFTTTYDANNSPISSYEAVPLLVPDKRVYVTPRELTGEQFSNGFSDRALSITALLHSLDTDFSAGAPLSPASIVNLSEDNKLTFLKGLLPATTAGEPRVVSSVDPDFLDVVNPGLEAISASRKISAALSAYLPIAQQATHSIAAGIYKANEPTYLFTGGGFIPGFDTLDKTTASNLASILGFSRLPFAAKTKSAALDSGGNSTCTAADCNTFFGYMSFGVDRSGRLFGFGTTEMRLNGSLLADPLALSPALSQKWPNSGDLKDMTLLLRNSDPSIPRTETIVMTQGVVDQGSMAASSEMYKDYFGADASVDARLGRWELKNGNTVLMGASSDVLPPRMELRHGYNAFPILNPDVWDSIASFPLHFKAVITEGCTTASCNKVEVNFSVLEDGNIISDRDADCAAVDSALKESSGDMIQELPIGVVTRAFVNDGAGATGGKYLIPLILLPSELVSSTETRQIEIGTTAAARLRVDNNDFGIYSNASAATDGSLNWYDFYILNKTFVSNAALDPKYSGTITTSKAACMP